MLLYSFNERELSFKSYYFKEIPYNEETLNIGNILRHVLIQPLMERLGLLSRVWESIFNFLWVIFICELLFLTQMTIDLAMQVGLQIIN